MAIRDKLISIRVNSKILEKVNKILDEKKIKITWRCDGLLIGDSEYYHKKPNNADLFELFLKEFINKYEKTSM